MHESIDQILTTQPLSPLAVSNAEFLTTITRNVPLPVNGSDNPAFWLTAFAGDPHKVGSDAWRGGPIMRPFGEGILPRNDHRNLFFAVSYFFADGVSLSRTVRCFGGLFVLVIDDLGQKIPWEKIKLPLSWVLRTSPDSYQGGYILAAPERDRVRATALISGMIYVGLGAEKDPGMAGLTRNVRLPDAINGKAEYRQEYGITLPMSDAPRCQLVQWNPEREYSIEEIAQAYGIDLENDWMRSDYKTDVKLEDDPWVDVWSAAGLLKQGRAAGPWLQVTCPDVETHTGALDNGSAYALGGGYKCHHNCEDRLTWPVVRNRFMAGEFGPAAQAAAHAARAQELFGDVDVDAIPVEEFAQHRPKKDVDVHRVQEWCLSHLPQRGKTAMPEDVPLVEEVVRGMATAYPEMPGAAREAIFQLIKDRSCQGLKTLRDLYAGYRRSEEAGWRQKEAETRGPVLDIPAWELLPLDDGGYRRIDGTRAVVEPTQDGLVSAFVEVCRRGQALVYVPESGSWCAYDGMRWVPDTTGRAFHLMHRIARAVEMGGAPDEEPRVLATSNMLRGALDMARHHPVLVREKAAFDADPWLLNTRGGIVDLRTCELLPHDPARMLSKIAGASPEGDCPLWLAFLDQISYGRPEWVDFVQRAVGMTLIGEIVEHALIFAFGKGGNGKGVLMRTIGHVLGSYATTAESSIFTVQQQQQHRHTIAVLAGARFVASQEISKGKKWDEAQLKDLSGGDVITANLMRQNAFTFKPQWTIWIAANNRPAFPSVDDGIRRRFHLVPFDYSTPNPDKTLEGRMWASESDGILAWCLDGVRAFLDQGLNPPACITDGTRAYLDSQDLVGLWLAENCVVLPADGERSIGWTVKTKREDLWNRFREWCFAAGARPGTAGEFYQDLEDRWIRPAKIKGVRNFRGIKLREKSAEEQNSEAEKYFGDV